MDSCFLYKNIGLYKHFYRCRFCYSENIEKVINLGYVPLAGGFINSNKEFVNEKFFPLELSFCKDCFLAQSDNVIDPDALFKNYFYHSSAIKTLTSHFIKTANEISDKLKGCRKSLVVEIGCNDGAFIKQVLKNKINALGVDPATNVVKSLINSGFTIVNDYFTEKVANKIRNKYGSADVIFSSNTLAHITDMHDVVRGIKALLKDNGKLIFEVHYLGKLINEMQYDMIYHEHQYYYSLITLRKFFEKYNMEIYKAQPISIHAGSMRYYVRNKIENNKVLQKNVEIIIKNEKDMKLDKIKTYREFNKKIKETKADLISLLKEIKKKKLIIAGYGASGRGTIIMNYCGLDKNYLDYVIDDAPAKIGKITPGTHLEIVSSSILKSKKRPDYVILFAWSFLDEIKKKNTQYLKNGGKFIIPLPKVRIIEK